MTHTEGRSVLLAAWPLVTSEAPTRPELQIAAAVAVLETSYGTSWTGDGAGSNNWGAIKCVSVPRPPCEPDCFASLDRGGEWCFRRYASPAEGAAAVVRQLTVRRPTVWAAMRAGDVRRVALEMSRTGYFEADARAYGEALVALVRGIAAELGEPEPKPPAPSRSFVAVAAVVAAAAAAFVLSRRRAAA
jgi:hypothetical protein